MNQFEIDGEYDDAAGLSGIDEAGRGCLAGPVVVASVTWNPKTVQTLSWFPDLADSKQLDEARREKLYPQIVEAADRVRVAVISPILIDYLNILKATLHGFEMVAPPADHNRPLLIDGNQKPASLKWARTVVKGDSRVSVVAGAGILAKVTRDAIMVAMESEYPGYGFEVHKGYATARHRKAIEELGPCCLHRKSFRPVSDHDQPGGDHDIFLLTPPEDLAKHYGWFTTNYHKVSREAAHTAVDWFHRAGLRVIPNPSDDFCIRT